MIFYAVGPIGVITIITGITMDSDIPCFAGTNCHAGRIFTFAMSIAGILFAYFVNEAGGAFLVIPCHAVGAGCAGVASIASAYNYLRIVGAGAVTGTGIGRAVFVYNAGGIHLMIIGSAIGAGSAGVALDTLADH